MHLNISVLTSALFLFPVHGFIGDFGHLPSDIRGAHCFLWLAGNPLEYYTIYQYTVKGDIQYGVLYNNGHLDTPNISILGKIYITAASFCSNLDLIRGRSFVTGL